MIKGLYDCGVLLISYAIDKKKWSGFTGNAQTSFTIGIYNNGVLQEYVNGEMVRGRKALRKKIQLGKRVYLKRPYEGRSRAVVGSVEASNEYGTDTALSFLKSFKAQRNGLSMVMTIGVEYYMFLGGGDANALVDAYNVTPSMLDKVVWKRISV